MSWGRVTWTTRTGAGAAGRALAAGAGVTGVSAPVVNGMARATPLLAAAEDDAPGLAAGLQAARRAAAAIRAMAETDEVGKGLGILSLPDMISLRR